MAPKIVVTVMPEETRMALVEKRQLIELLIERPDKVHIVGNIYKGRIKNVLPGMQAAFIDIGLEKNAFLYIGNAMPRHSANSSFQDEMLTVGKDILIQIIKDAIGTKGPRAATNLTLPGRYVVLMPTVDYIGISRRIESDSERERLRTIAGTIRPEGMGLIVRTVAEGKSEEDLRKDVEYLTKLWSAITARARRTNGPTLLYRDVDLVIRMVRDYLTNDVEEIIIDNQEAYNRVCDLLKFILPELVTRIKLADSNSNIWSAYGLEEEVEKLGQRRVWLECGGYIVIDKTEALTVIDVNTGKFVGQTNLADTVFQTNMEAAVEIARQVRLRDIGGIIIIDFIDMGTKEHQQAVLSILEEKLRQDKTKTNVLGLTGLGLVELTRKKARQSAEGILYSECPYCDGKGLLQSVETVIINLRRELRRISWDKSNRRPGGLIIQIHPRIAELLPKTEIKRLEQEFCRSITLEFIPEMHPNSFLILADNK